MKTQKERIDYIVNLYQQIKQDKSITKDTMIKNTTIETLCESNGGPYQRIKDWCEKTLKKKNDETLKEVHDEYYNKEFIFKSIQESCFNLMISRNKKYGESWRVLSIESIANLIEMKMNRIAKLGSKEPKAIDEFEDTINYATFALIKLKEQNDKQRKDIKKN